MNSLRENSALSRMTPRERKALEGLAIEAGQSAELLAQEMAAAFMRLVLDAPAALPSRPLMGLVQRAGRGLGR